MLEPLPQGKHDRRVSSAESGARQDWPSKPTEDYQLYIINYTLPFQFGDARA